jgi:2,4-dienoyl-CoA reductase (NADPH2)
MMPKVGADVGKSTKWVLFGNLKKYGVKILINSKVISIQNGTVTFETEDKTKRMNFDSVILASGSRPVKRISSEIKKLGIPYSIIGDCIAPGKINDAIHGGFMAALSI